MISVAAQRKPLALRNWAAASFPSEDLRQLGGLGIEQASLKATKEREKGVKGLER